MNALLVVAANTFREAVRNKVLYVLVCFAIVLIFVSKALGWISVEEDVKVITDVSLAAIAFFSVIITIFIGTDLLRKEMDRRTLYTILAKPVPRWTFVLGKYAGLMITLLVNLALMGAVFLGFLAGMGGSLHRGLFEVLVLLFLELAVLTSFALLISNFTSSLLSAVITFIIYIAGHQSDNILYLKPRVSPVLYEWFLRPLYLLIPNLGNYEYNLQAVHRIPIGMEVLGPALLYTFLYAGIMLVLACWAFSRKNF